MCALLCTVFLNSFFSHLIKRTVDPGEDLIERTAKGITHFIFNFEIQKQNAQQNGDSKNSFRAKPRFSGTGG